VKSKWQDFQLALSSLTFLTKYLIDMDTNSQFALIGSGATAICFGLWQLVQFWNHRNVRSHCCGKTAEMGIDIDSPQVVVPQPQTQPPKEIVAPK
jgi:high-affinity Fe2+/Pb2+ permease